MEAESSSKVRFGAAVEEIPAPMDSVDEPYFSYYASLANQMNMLSDVVRTTAYKQAILGNAVDSFKGKTVLDVGAGSGILSFFSSEAGASSVYSCEASSMAAHLEFLLKQSGNAKHKEVIHVCKGKIEDQKSKIPKVDTIVSEPIGVLLVHERMVESFIYARDHFLKPGGSLYPSSGAIMLAPFTDAELYQETLSKADFFTNDVYGVDMSGLAEFAKKEAFDKPVVGLFPASQLISSATSNHIMNFYTLSMDELKEFEIPISWKVEKTALMHGIATWFDIQFDPVKRAPTFQHASYESMSAQHKWETEIWETAVTNASVGISATAGQEYPSPPKEGVSITLSTSPHAAKTHWQQTRLLFAEPLAVNAGEEVRGLLKMKINDQRSYDIEAEVSLAGRDVQDLRTTRKAVYQLHLQTFNYNPAI